MPAMDPSDFRQNNWRLFQSNAVPGSETALANENTTYQFGAGSSTPFMLYMQIADIANGSTSTAAGENFQLQASVNGGTTWFNVTGVSTTVRAIASTHFADSDPCPDVGLTNSYSNATHASIGLDEDNGVPSTNSLNGSNRHTAGFSLTTMANIGVGVSVTFRISYSGITGYLRYPYLTYGTSTPPATPYYKQEGFRARNDDGDEDEATWQEAEGQAWTQLADQKFRVRGLIGCTGASESGFRPGIKYAVNTGMGYGTEIVCASSPAALYFVTSPNVSSSSTTVTQQIGAGTFMSGLKGIMDSGTVQNLTTTKDREMELEAVLQVDSAFVPDGSQISFKFTNGAGNTDLQEYNVTLSFFVQHQSSGEQRRRTSTIFLA